MLSPYVTLEQLRCDFARSSGLTIQKWRGRPDVCSLTGLTQPACSRMARAILISRTSRKSADFRL